MAARLASATLAAAVISGLLAPAALAADEAPFTLPRGTAAAVTADLDGDGARELVRIAEAVPSRIDPAHDLAVEVWSYGRDGWSMTGLAGLVRPTADGASFVSVEVETDGFGLLFWRDAGRERALVVTGVGPSRQGGSGVSVCCLALLDVALGPDGLSLPELGGADGEVEAVMALDMDADGTDELVVTEPSGPETARHATVLRWDGVAFGAERFEIGLSGQFGTAVMVGETDGNPGDEAVFGPTADGTLVRVGASADGGLYREAATWDARQPEGFPWFAGAAGGLLVAQFPGMLATWRWPPGEEPSLVEQLVTRDSSVFGMLTAGEEVAFVETDWGVLVGARGPALTRVHRPDMPPLDFEPTAAVLELMELSRTEFEAVMQSRFGLYPYFGPLPGGDGLQAYVSMGNLITLANSGELNVEPIGAMVGGYPLAAAGPGASWMVMSQGYVGGSPVFLFAGGGFFGSTVSLVPRADVLEAEAEGVVRMAPSASTRGTWIGDATERTFVPEAGLRVTVTGPIGSSVVAVVDRSIVYEATLAGEPAVITLQPVNERETNQTYEAVVVVMTAAGQAYLERWDLVILRERPELLASGKTLLGELAASVTGLASRHATVLVDGQTVALDAEGRFEVRVDAAPWPRDVRVVARDAIGNETAVLVSVVGLFDYRGLPWVAIVAVVTVLAGLWLFVRTPRGVRQPMLLDDGVRLEELDAPR